jgi:hypothetical protein
MNGLQESQKSTSAPNAIVPTGAEKECSMCKTKKPLSEFYRDKSRKDGLHYACKECNRKYQRKKEPSVCDTCGRSFMADLRKLIEGGGEVGSGVEPALRRRNREGE